ncbi:type II toxin-antitoxin system Phd/YefM family antitoxin [Bradyrhizobium sp. 2TAF24]|uniref:type II toxin-antitoxin system Phd/YefM family antitoxin n=1 Tax=Bradyrhizobium sp. 2TAF24 TaxID=3233011 RepID=UPI003F90E090
MTSVYPHLFQVGRAAFPTPCLPTRWSSAEIVPVAAIDGAVRRCSAEKGCSTIITRHGRPVAALVPIEAYGAAVRQQPLLPVAGSGRGLWDRIAPVRFESCVTNGAAGPLQAADDTLAQTLRLSSPRCSASAWRKRPAAPPKWWSSSL